MERDEKEIGCGLVLVGLLLIVPGMLWRGWVAAVMWHWFVVPLGAFRLGAVHAAGLLALLSFVRYRSIDVKEGRDAYIKAIVFEVFNPLMALGLAWVLKSLM